METRLEALYSVETPLKVRACCNAPFEKGRSVKVDRRETDLLAWLGCLVSLLVTFSNTSIYIGGERVAVECRRVWRGQMHEKGIECGS